MSQNVREREWTLAREALTEEQHQNISTRHSPRDEQDGEDCDANVQRGG